MLVVAGAGLNACGSGSSSDPATDAAVLKLSGTAATGLAIAGQPVTAKCNGGSGNATTNADGTYTIDVTTGSLPCMVSVTTADGGVLHSLAMGTGTTARVNITPVSELVMARLTGGDPAAAFAAFDSAAASALTEANVSAAVTAVVETLRSAGIDLSDFGNVLTAELTAATGTTSGNALDQALDALGAALSSSGTTLAQMVESVGQGSPQAVGTHANLASLPAELLLKPAASTCPSLRSGTYRVISSAGPSKMEFNATTMMATVGETSTEWTADGDATCRYSWATGTGTNKKAVVSPAGVIVLLTETSTPGQYRQAVLFPEQVNPVAELAGTWSTLEWQSDDSGAAFELISADVTFDANGQATAVLDCSGADLLTCVEEPTAGGLAAHADGGYEGSVDLAGLRAFIYRSGSGALMFAAVDEDKSVIFATKKRTRSMPAVGDLGGGWSTTANKFGVATAFSEARTTITEVDPTAGSFVRVSDLDATRVETLTINSPRDGFMHRAPETEISEIAILGLRGMGMSTIARLNPNTTNSFFGFSVDVR